MALVKKYNVVPMPPIETRNWSTIVPFDDVPMQLAWKYIGRLDRWTLSMFTEENTEIFTGRHVLPYVDLLRRSRHIPECPVGPLTLMPNDILDLTPLPADEFSKENSFYYITEEDDGQ